VLWHRRKKTDRVTREECAEASKALHKAEDDLQDAKDQNQEINQVVTKVARYGEENNFAEMIRQAFGGTAR